MVYHTIPETPQEPKPKKLLGQIAVASFLLGACAATIYHAKTTGVAASLEVTPGATYTKEWTCSSPYVDTAVYGQSSGPLSAAGLTVTLGGTELSENGETSFEFGRSEHVTAELVPSDGVTVSDWAFGGLIGELGGLLPGAAGVQVSCTGIMPPVVNKETEARRPRQFTLPMAMRYMARRGKSSSRRSSATSTTRARSKFTS